MKMKVQMKMDNGMDTGIEFETEMGMEMETGIEMEMGMETDGNGDDGDGAAPTWASNTEMQISWLGTTS